MRIAMFLDTDFPPDPRVENEATSLIEDGHEVFLFSLDYRGSGLRQEVINGITVMRFSASNLLYKLSALAYTIPVYHLLLKTKIRKFIEEIRPDALHIHDLPIARAVFAVNKVYQLPVVLDLHEDRSEIMKYYPHLQKGLGKLLIKPQKWEKWQYRLINQSTKTIVVTEEAKATLVERDKTLESKVIVVPNSIKADIFDSYKIDSGIASRFVDKKVILYLGDTGQRRGLETAILGMKNIVERIPNALLVIVGKSTDDVYLKKLATDSGVEDKVVFEGWQDLKLFPSYITACKVAISPLKRNRHHDTTYANKIFQYMALGRPQVVSDCPAQARVIEEARAGLVYPAEDVTAYANCIIELLSDDDLNRSIGENAKAAIQAKWDWKFTSQELLNNYRELQGGAG